MSKFLDENGLLYLWGKIKTLAGGKVDKVEGKGLSTEDFTTALKEKLEGLPESIAEATTEKAGLLSAADKARLDGIRGVRYGTEAPADMKDGELFVRVISVAEET